MKLRTHAATAMLAALLFDALAQRYVPGYAGHYVLRAMLVAEALVLQYLVDAVGHTVRRRNGRVYYARNRWHSLPAAVGMGLGAGLPLAILSGVYAAAASPVLALLVHLAEDVVTEGGVYVGGRRVRLGGVRYDSPLANRLAILALLVPAVLVYPAFSSAFNTILATFVYLYSLHALLTV